MEKGTRVQVGKIILETYKMVPQDVKPWYLKISKINKFGETKNILERFEKTNILEDKDDKNK